MYADLAARLVRLRVRSLKRQKLVSGHQIIRVACLRKTTTGWWLACAGASEEYGKRFNRQGHGRTLLTLRRWCRWLLLLLQVLNAGCIWLRVRCVEFDDVSVPSDVT